MIYENYKPESDPFYDTGINYDLTIKNLNYVTTAEYLKQRILCSRCWSFYDNEASAKESILYLLLSVPFLTYENLDTLKIHNSKAAIRTFINRLEKVKQPAIKTMMASNTRLSEKVIYLNSDTYYFLYYSYLPSDYLSRRHISPNAKTPALGTFYHDSNAINLICYFLVDRNFNFFEFWWRAPINMYKSFEESITDYEGNDSRGTEDEIFIPDAVLKSKENESIVFVEQDMSTERLNRLKQKFDSYLEYLNRRDMEDLNHHSILVSIDTKHSQNLRARPHKINEVVKRHELNSFKYLETLAITYNTNSLDDFVKILERTLKCNSGDASSTKRVKNMKNLIISARSNVSYNISTIDDLGRFVASEKNRLVNQDRNYIDCLRKKIFLGRLKTFQRLVMETKDFQHLFGLGMSFYVIDNQDVTILPYLMIQQYKTYNTLMKLVMEQHIRFEFEYSYKPYIYRHDDNMCFFIKNAVYYQNSRNEIFISFENISLDIGAAYRVQYWLSEIRIYNAHLFYYLLIESEKDAINFYNSVLVDRQMPSNIHVAFILLKRIEHNNEKVEISPLVFTIEDGMVVYC